MRLYCGMILGLDFLPISLTKQNGNLKEVQEGICSDLSPQLTPLSGETQTKPNQRSVKSGSWNKFI